MRYKYNKKIPAGAMLISLQGLYGIRINSGMTQVIVDSKRDNLVVNLNDQVLSAIQDDPDFTALDAPAKVERPVVPKEQLEDPTLPGEKLDKLFAKKEEKKEVVEEVKKEAPKKTATKRGRKPKAETKQDS